MITMIDEIYDRRYQADRAQLNLALAESIGRLARSVTNAFAVLNRIEYSAPWSAPAKKARCN